MGNIITDITGTTSSAKQQYRHQLNLQKDAQNFAKWQMANAHQMEVQDLQNAGLNPVLSAGDSGASAGVTEGSASTGTASGDPISMIGNIVATINNARTTDKQLQEIDSQINKNNAEAYKTWITSDPEAKKLEIEYSSLVQGIKNAKSERELTEAQAKFEKWKSEHPYQYLMMSSLPGALSSGVGLFVLGRAGKFNKPNSAKTTTKNTYNRKGEFTGSTVTTTR